MSENTPLINQNSARDLDPNVLQRRASNPQSSVWVGASAGTGKTKVLTDRVLRLLLPIDENRAGTPPYKILGLTFTKAAASEMALRINETLADWAVLPLEKLDTALKNLLGRTPEAHELTAARRLFADVVDDGVGLQIMTIHSFCQSVLGRFPLEAGLSPYFSLLEDTESAAMLQAAQKQVLSGHIGNDDNNDNENPNNAALERSIDRLVCYLTEEQFTQLTGGVIKERSQLFSLLEKQFGIDGLYENICAFFGIKTGLDPENAHREACEAININAMKEAAQLIGEFGTDKEQDKANKLIDFINLPQDQKLARFDDYCGIFLTTKFKPLKKLITNNVVDNAPHLLPIMEKEAERLVATKELERKIICANLTTDLMRLGQKILERYAALKAEKGVLDYDDLIMKTAALLARGDMRGWVNYKLDQGLDHILVDEAQDTNPQQWEIIRALCDEFYAGADARNDTQRSVFVVGDEKQSIYSFQRASPKAFNDMRHFFAKRITQAQEKWDEVGLNISFRSTAPILDIVDAVMSNVTLYSHDGESEASTPIKHNSFRVGQAGLCTLWPIFTHDDVEASPLWSPPITIEDTASGAAKMAEHIAQEIKHWLESGETLEGYDRPIKAGDIMILMRTRSKLVGQLTQALKKHNIPVGGHDRMVLSAQLVIQDLLALAEFGLLPSDDLTLAALLKSPFIGLSEDELFSLCHERKNSLWASILDSDQHQHIAAYLTQWIAYAQSMRPFEFFNLALHAPCPADEKSGMRALVKRLGADIRDPIQSFLNEALLFENTHTAAMQYFVHQQKTSVSSIKREMDGQYNHVRIMTIHASKGLQAPIVLLPDTMRTTRTPPAKTDMRLIWPQQSELAVPLYAPNKENEPRLYQEAKSELEARMDEEYRRLLYVAMTRAEERLYIGGYLGKKNTALPDSWYYDIERGFNALKDSSHMSALEDGTRIYRKVRTPDKTADKLGKGESHTTQDATTPPAWAFQPAAPEATNARTIIPSRLTEDDSELPASSPFDQKNEYRFLRGNITHKLLEFLPELPPEQQRPAAVHYLARYNDELSGAIIDNIIDEIFTILNHSQFSAIFGQNSRAEVSIGGFLSHDDMVSGQIDRLLITDERILILDYKTNRPPPKSADNIPAVYLRQMQSYKRAILSIYPGRTIECALLWTDGPDLMLIPDALLT